MQALKPCWESNLRCEFSTFFLCWWQISIKDLTFLYEYDLCFYKKFSFAWKGHSKAVRFVLGWLSFEAFLSSPPTCFSTFLAFLLSYSFFYLFLIFLCLCNSAACTNRRRVLCNNFFIYCFDSWGLLGQQDTKSAKQWNALSCLHCSQLQRLQRLNGLVSSVPSPPRTHLARGRRASNEKEGDFFFL